MVPVATLNALLIIDSKSNTKKTLLIIDIDNEKNI